MKKKYLFWIWLIAICMGTGGCGSERIIQDIVSGQNDSYDKEAEKEIGLTEEEAKSMILKRVPGAVAADVYIELEREDGHWVYEGEIHYDRKEYEFEMNASNGQLLEWSEEEED